jgi:hypothetical protein
VTALKWILYFGSCFVLGMSQHEIAQWMMLAAIFLALPNKSG